MAIATASKISTLAREPVNGFADRWQWWLCPTQGHISLCAGYAPDWGSSPDRFRVDVGRSRPPHIRRQSRELSWSIPVSTLLLQFRRASDRLHMTVRNNLFTKRDMTLRANKSGIRFLLINLEIQRPTIVSGSRICDNLPLHRMTARDFQTSCGSSVFITVMLWHPRAAQIRMLAAFMPERSGRNSTCSNAPGLSCR